MKAPNNLLNCICNLSTLFLLFSLLLFSQSSNSQQLAFPSAKGAGAYASGGRGGTVSIVTNLNDSGVGSLRSFSNVSNTTIVFNVSGIINLSNTLYLYGNNVTIAGQTAPEGGITIDGARVIFSNTDNLICRFIRFRGGYAENNDTVGGYYLNNVIFDHCSISFGGDEAFSIIVDSPDETGGEITIQNCLLAESSTGGIMGGREAPDNVYGISLIANVYYNISHRFPNLNSNSRYDVINNYVYNHSKRMIRGNFGYKINEIGNLYDYGNNRVWDQTLNHHGCETGNEIPIIYAQGNTIVGIESQRDNEAVSNTIAEMNANNNLMWKYFYDNNSECGYGLKNRGDQLEADYFADIRLPILGKIPVIFDALELKTQIVPNAGASKRLNQDGSISDNNDALDTAWKANIEAGIYVVEISEANYTVPAIISITREDSYDSDNDGMSDEWELLQFNTTLHDGTLDSDGNGYTDLEEYLNGVDADTNISAIGVESIAITPNPAELQITDALQLTATFTPSNATNQNGIWSSSDEAIATVDATGLVTPVDIGEVIITFIADDGGFTDISEITVFPEALQASAGIDQQICEGESVTLTAIGGTSYVWGTGEITESIEVTPNATITYTVTVSDDFGQSEEASVTVTVNSIPLANAGEDQTICLGQSATLIATGGVSYLWNTGETTASIEVNPLVETSYSVEVSNENCSIIDEVTVFVAEIPNIIISEDIVIVKGETTTLTATGGENYEWSTNETTESIEVNPAETTTYIVNSVSGSGCISSANVTVTVIAEIIADAGEDVTICDGEFVTLSASGGLTYLWNTGDSGSELIINPTITTTYIVTVEDEYGYTKNDSVTVFVNESPNITVGDDVFIMIGDSTTLTANGGNNFVWSTGETTNEISVSPDVTTTYIVTGFSENGCQNTAEVTVTVVEVLNANAGEDVSICLGESVTLNASGGITYIWNTGGSGATPTITPTETTTYTVTITDGFGNSDTDDVIVTVNPLPIANAGENQTICVGEFVNLTAEGGDAYLWSTGETTANITVNPNEDTIYTVETYSNNCSDSADVTVFVSAMPEFVVSEDITITTGSSTTLLVSGGDSYLWNTGDTSNSIEVSPMETTTYSVTGFSANGCQSVAEVTVIVITEINADAGNDVAICFGESVTLNASGGINYAWSTGETDASLTLNPIETTTYMVTVTDSFGNSDTDSVTVIVNELPTITISESITIIEGDSTNLLVSGAETYLWNTGDNENSITVNPTETTTYSVTGFSANGCQSVAEVTVTVIAEINADAGNDVAICFGESVTLNASGGINYAWSTGETDASLTLNPIETTTYMVTVTDSFGNSDTDSVTVTVNELPTLLLTEDVTIFEGESINLTVNGAESYLWNTGDTSNSIVVNPTITSTYSVTGFSSSNCETSAEVTVTVIPEINANAGNDVAICLGESITLNASGGINYSWNTGETTASMIVSPIETTTYTVTVTDDLGNSDSDSMTVTVNELPLISTSENITIIEGESTDLIVNGAVAYLWNTGDTSSSITVSPTQTTIYSVVGISNTCTSEPSEIIVTVIPLFQASAGTDSRVCDNESYEVILTANEGDSYLWSTGETSQSIVVNPLSTSTYSVTVTQGDQSDTDDVKVYVDPSPVVTIANGESVEILRGDFVTLSAFGANTYRWNNGASQPNIAVSPSITTTYEIKGFIGECYDEKQVTVNVLNRVIADAGEDVFACLEEVSTLTASGGDDYIWSTGETTRTIEVSPTETTDYTVTVFNALDFDEATVRVEVGVNCASDSIDEETEIGFDVYPNPVSDIVNVKVFGVLNVSDVNIYDVTGKLVKHSKITNENLEYTITTQIGISSLQSGVYFIKLIGNGRAMTKKLIVE
ncbi:Ig-like domain-containing protein [Winogradskyella costae]|uniref:Ig-like domain-containing protein n=1 Tax=Winogradskyella costae TaxID=2697008 RepID=UPI0015CCD8BB|nr:Ig-like domain-containing protein [Winogradskyella costae]